MTHLINLSTPSHFGADELSVKYAWVSPCTSQPLKEHMFSPASCHIADTSSDPWADVLSGASRPSGFCSQVCRFCLRCPLNAPLHSVTAAVFHSSRGQPRFTYPPGVQLDLFTQWGITIYRRLKRTPSSLTPHWNSAKDIASHIGHTPGVFISSQVQESERTIGNF